MATKASLRAQFRASRAQRRRSFFAADREAEQAGLLSSYRDALSFFGVMPLLPALFVPTLREPDVTKVLEVSPRVLLPRLSDEAGSPLPAPAWGEWRPGSALRRGRAGVGEPCGSLVGAHRLGEVDFFVIPALAISREGVRLGQGGGWYDRALAQVSPAVPVVGVVFDDEVTEVGSLPRESHDRGVHGIVTPSRFIPIF